MVTCDVNLIWKVIERVKSNFVKQKSLLTSGIIIFQLNLLSLIQLYLMIVKGGSKFNFVIQTMSFVWLLSGLWFCRIYLNLVLLVRFVISISSPILRSYWTPDCNFLSWIQKHLVVLIQFVLSILNSILRFIGNGLIFFKWIWKIHLKISIVQHQKCSNQFWKREIQLTSARRLGVLPSLEFCLKDLCY